MDDDPLIAQPAPGDPERGERRGQRGRGGALQVVVERAAPVLVLAQDAPGVAGAEVFPVQHGVREQLGGRGHVRLDEIVVTLAADPGVPVAEVHLVAEQPEVIRADVQHDRDGAARVDPGRGGVHGQLADRDVHAAHPLVADAEDAFRVGGDDEVDVVRAAAVDAERLLGLFGRVDRQVHPARPAELMAESFDRLPDGRRVDDRQHLVDVLAEQPEEQHLVAVAQVTEVDVLGHVVGLAPVLLVYPAQLAVQRGDPAGQQAGQPEGPPLRRGEGRAPVEHRAGKHRSAPGPDPDPVPGGPPDQFIRSLVHRGPLLPRG